VKITETFHPASRAKWRAWLKRNQKKTEIWLVYDKGANRNITYAAAVEEALCFGWIDGIAKPIDEKQYAQRFTPRRGLNWSAINRKRFDEMCAQGLMTDAGRAVGPHLAKPLPKRWDHDQPLPPFIAHLKGFDALPPAQRRNYVRWVLEAKQEATRKSRLAKLIALLG
jgi:uncharacterized protein YdeI (YjbR/CyaY-like superfamily)